MNSQKEFLSKAEDIADEVLRKTKHLLPHLARFCLVSTFFEDGLRMWFQWQPQCEYMQHSWGCGWLLAVMFVLFNLVAQLGGVAMVLVRWRVDAAVTLLFAIVLLQTVAYQILWDVQFLLRNLALIGGLLMVLAETRVEGKSLFAGVPSLGENKQKTYLMLAGRILLVFMLATILRWDSNFLQLIQIVIGWTLMVLVTLGYKTKLSALVLVAWLMLFNVYMNAWWSVAAHKPMRDFLKYDFFQTLSVVGGLLMLIYLGPGGVSMDEHKKDW